MSFQDLPDDWPQRPLTDEDLVHDVLDLCVNNCDRDEGGIAVLALRSNLVLAQPVFVAGAIPAIERRTVLTNLLLACTLQELDATVVVAIAHADGALTDEDRAVHQLVLEICAEHAITLLSTHLVTSCDIRSLPARRRAVA